jgi:hypothetical protein
VGKCRAVDSFEEWKNKSFDELIVGKGKPQSQGQGLSEVDELRQRVSMLQGRSSNFQSVAPGKRQARARFV